MVGREDIDILAEIIFDGEEITVSAGSIKLQSKVLLAADPLPLAKIESGVSVPSLILSWLISDFWCFNVGVTKSLLVVGAFHFVGVDVSIYPFKNSVGLGLTRELVSHI